MASSGCSQLGLFSDLEIPELHADGDPEEQIAALSEATGRDIRPDFGQLVVYQSDELADAQASLENAQRIVVVAKRAVWLLVGLTIVLIAATILVARRRWRATLLLGVGGAAAMILTRALVRRVVDDAPELAAKPGGKAAIDAIVGGATTSLMRLAALVLLVAIAATVLALLRRHWRRADLVLVAAVAIGAMVVVVLDISIVSILLGIAVGVAAVAPRPPLPPRRADRRFRLTAGRFRAVSGGTRALVILGLSALAVTQPLLDLFGNNPEFFVAGNYSTSQIVLFALAITIVPPALGIGLTALATAINRRFGQVVFVAVCGVLATAFGLALLRTIGVDQLVVVALLGVLIGAVIVVLVLRTKGVRLLVSYLAVANLFFLATFLFFSPASELVAGASSGDVGDVDVPTPAGPVVFLVLDELPAATIMRADGSLNAERYPGFAELASVSTWFRNASSQYNLTHRAVPALLDGTPRRPRRPADVRRPSAQPVHPARRRGPRAALRVGHRPVPAGRVRATAAPAARPGVRGRLDRLWPSPAAEHAARRAAGDRQLVGLLRGG